jgi:hypothetical protein
MNNQEIIDKAPKGATHTETLASTRIYYLKKDANGMGYSVYLTNEWRTSMAVSGFIRSLADIKRIVELEKESDFLYEIACEATNPEWLHGQLKSLKEIKP